MQCFGCSWCSLGLRALIQHTKDANVNTHYCHKFMCSRSVLFIPGYALATFWRRNTRARLNKSCWTSQTIIILGVNVAWWCIINVKYCLMFYANGPCPFSGFASTSNVRLLSLCQDNVS